MPFGEKRTISGTTSITETDFTYTGQRDYSYIKLLDYKARFYSPTLGRFTQPDSVVPEPGNSQAWNRYSYSSNNPINRIDPSGHDDCNPGDCPDGDSSLAQRLFSNIITSIIASVKEIGATISNIPGKISPINIPIAIPRNISNIDEAGSLVTYTITGKDIRGIGRLVGDISNPIAYAIGYGATIAPNVIENIGSDAPISEWQSDLTIDTAGFIYSEGVGVIAGGIIGLITENPLALMITKLGADITASYLYEGWIEKNDLRYWVQYCYEVDCLEGEPIPMEFEPVPVPEPNQINPVTTPVPNSSSYGLNNKIVPIK